MKSKEYKSKRKNILIKLSSLLILLISCEVYEFDSPPAPNLKILNISNRSIEKIKIFFSDNLYVSRVNLFLDTSEISKINKVKNKIVSVNYDIQKYNKVRDSLIQNNQIEKWGNIIFFIQLNDSTKKEILIDNTSYLFRSGNNKIERLIVIRNDSLDIY